MIFKVKLLGVLLGTVLNVNLILLHCSFSQIKISPFSPLYRFIYKIRLF